LLLNGAFFAVNALREPDQQTSSHIIDESIPQLVLLNEQSIKKETPKPTESNSQDIEPVTETTKIDIQEDTPEEEPSLDLQAWLAKFTAERETKIKTTKQTEYDENNTSTLQCYTAGPFENSDSVKQAELFFNGSDINTQQRSIVENHYIGMLVYLPGQPDRQTVINIAENLASKGVKDYMLLNEPGKRNSLSLGVYGLKKNAEKRIQTLAKFNYNAKSEARYRQKTIYWLDYALNDDAEQIKLSEQQMENLSVSQIKRNCKT